jgi:uncharacterized protein YbjQ (UPF0145 family)
MAESPPTAPASPYRSGAEPTEALVVTTGNDVAGQSIVKYLGVVRGIIVRSTGFTRSFVGGFKALRAGNIEEYIEVCEAARHDAFSRMVTHAQELGADAIVAMRYDATEFMGGITEVLCYGTAVRLTTSLASTR